MNKPITLAQVLASLPEEERIILTLHYMRALSSSEIATMLSVPERAVDAVISTGKARLSALLDL
jgi:DNA-directed RNA polymerase specialized sigma24 family protein